MGKYIRNLYIKIDKEQIKKNSEVNKDSCNPDNMIHKHQNWISNIKTIKMTKLKMLSHLKYIFCLFASCFKKSRKDLLDKDDLMYQSGYNRVNSQLDIINVLTSIQKLKACMVAIMNEKRICPDS
jgi:hypothetical protein